MLNVASACNADVWMQQSLQPAKGHALPKQGEGGPARQFLQAGAAKSDGQLAVKRYYNQQTMKYQSMKPLDGSNGFSEKCEPSRMTRGWLLARCAAFQNKWTGLTHSCNFECLFHFCCFFLFILYFCLAKPLVKVLERSDSMFEVLWHPALRAIGNLLTGTQAHTDVVIEAGVCNVLGRFLYLPQKSIKKDTLWTL